MSEVRTNSVRMVSELRDSLHGKRKLLAALALWSLLEALPAFLCGQLVTRAVDSGFIVGRPFVGLSWLVLLGVTVFAGAWGTRQVYPRLAAIVEPFRDGLLRRAVRGSLARSAAEGRNADAAGVARLTQQVEIAREAYAGLLMVVRGFVFTVGGALTGLLWLDPLLLALVLPPLAAGLAVFFLLVGRMTARQRELILADERLAEAATSTVDGLRDIMAFGEEGRFSASLGRLVEEQLLAASRLATVATGRIAAVATGGWLPLLAVIAAAPWLLRHGATAGTVMGAIVYITEGLLPALRTLIQGLGGSGIRLSVAMNRIREMDAPTAVRPVEPVAAVPTLASFRNAVDLRAVTFSYGPHADPVISGLDLEIAEGDHLAVVGPSGIGKSTLASLMAGLLTPEQGEVRLGGIPLRRLDPREVPSLRVLIPQEAYVFSGTVEENLRYLRPTASTAHMDHAVEALGLSPLMKRLGSYQAQVRPSDLSAGERQQLALARAYLSSTRLIILDEATCHLDAAAEALAEEAFARRAGALVVIAHRISSALRARRILVLNGSRAEVGSHEDMLAVSPLYRDLVGHWTVDVSAAPR